MGDEEFPGLKFNPAKGIVSAVEGLAGQLQDAVNRLGGVEAELDGVLRNAQSWQGRAGAQFQVTMSRMAPNVGVTKECLAAAQQAIGGWAAALGGFQRTRDSLEAEAVEARARVKRAKGNKDLKLDPKLLMFANNEDFNNKMIDANIAAKAELKAAEDALDGIINEAKRLETQHDDEAKAVARRVKAAIKQTTGEIWKQAHWYPPAPAYYPTGPGGMGDPGQVNLEYDQILGMYFRDQPEPGGFQTQNVPNGPVMPGNGVLMFRFFIPDDKAAFGVLHGDDRDFSTDPSAPYRMALLWDTDTGKIVFSVSPSDTTGVFPEAKIPAHDIGPGEENNVDFDIRDNGFTADITGLNSLLPYFAANEKVEVELPGPQGGPARVKLHGDDYPNFEVVQYFPNKEPMLHGTDEMYEPPLPGIDSGVAATPGVAVRTLEWVGADPQPVSPLMPVVPSQYAPLMPMPDLSPPPQPSDPW